MFCNLHGLFSVMTVVLYIVIAISLFSTTASRMNGVPDLSTDVIDFVQ